MDHVIHRESWYPAGVERASPGNNYNGQQTYKLMDSTLTPLPRCPKDGVHLLQGILRRVVPHAESPVKVAAVPWFTSSSYADDGILQHTPGPITQIAIDRNLLQRYSQGPFVIVRLHTGT